MTTSKTTLASFVAVSMALHVCVCVCAQESRAEPPKNANHSSQERPAGLENDFSSVKRPGLLEAKPLKVSSTDDDLVKLLKLRHNAAAKELQIALMAYRHGTASSESAFGAARRVGHSRLELAKTADEKIAIRKELLELAKQIEEQTRAMHEAAIVPATDYYRARYFRLDAEIELVRAQRELAEQPAK